MIIIPLNSPDAHLANAGGKAANLSKLLRAGYPVPPGYILPVAGYHSHVRANGLDPALRQQLALLDPSNPASLEQVSTQIRSLFRAAPIPERLRKELAGVVEALGGMPLAVRSSATTEDLPDLSYAGLHETFLNVVGLQAVEIAVRECWSSLWTARAIGYRRRYAIDSSGIAQAVILQPMVESLAAGVLFSANPLSGLRSEAVIEAAFGLGEALVSGQVEPDRYIVDTQSWKITSRSLGRKQLSLHTDSAGGLQRDEQDRSTVQALGDEQILALARMASDAAQLLGAPQDIEWAWNGSSLSLLQSRPITSLYPVPDNLARKPVTFLASFGAVQGMLDPITPLGQSILRSFFAAGSSLVGYKSDEHTQKVLYPAGYRLWVNISGLLNTQRSRGWVLAALRQVEPSIAQALEQMLADPAFKPLRKDLPFSTRLNIFGFGMRILRNIVPNLLNPEKRRRAMQTRINQMLATAQKEMQAIQGKPAEVLARRAKRIRTLPADTISSILPLFLSAVASGMGSWMQIRNTSVGAQKQAEWDRLALEINRAVPHNPTTEMNFNLWKTASRLQADPATLRLLLDTPPDELAHRYQHQRLPQALLEPVERFLEEYGYRGLAEIDLGRPRWHEQPAAIFEMLTAYVQLEDAYQAPDRVYSRGSASAAEAARNLEKMVRKGPFGFLRAARLRFLIDRARRWLGIREAPKFMIVRLFGILRQALLEPARALQAEGILESAEDIVFLYLNEIPEFAYACGIPAEALRWREQIAARRAAYDKEKSRRQIPRLLLSDGRAVYAGLSPEEGPALLGSPVSPGAVQGRVRVVLNPSQAQLQQGEILVCPGTDPSWTPLFLRAAGLIMEVGGMMTHGAVVAREYGIPAVDGVDQVTRRLRDGMHVAVDGTSGEIRLLSESEA